MSRYLIVGGTSGLGLEIARYYADAGHRVTLTSRDADRAAAAAKDVGGDTSGLALDLAAPKDIDAARAGIESVDGLVLAAIERDVTESKQLKESLKLFRALMDRSSDAIEVVDPDNPARVVGYGETGRVRLTTLTREFFMPRFLERDEAERDRRAAD